MPSRDKTKSAPAPGELLLGSDTERESTPIWLAHDARWLTTAPLTGHQKAWLEALGFKGQGLKPYLIPAADGSLAGVVLALGKTGPGDAVARPELGLGLLPPQLPPGLYHCADALEDGQLAAIAWGLGAYRFTRYKHDDVDQMPVLKLPRGIDAQRTTSIVEAIWLGRDLINTPSSDLGPQELEDVTRALAQRHSGSVASIVGDDLLASNLPMLHAVGRASTRLPRLIDLTWGSGKAPRVTLVGKGICFDTGGLDIKSSSAMLIMKKDMGGAAAALALGHMLMSAKLDLTLRIVLPTADNSIAGNAFRPGDVLRSHAGATVEIGNTDAEGRLVLADALALADAQAPDMLLAFATLTGAARVALGPEVVPFYTDNDAFAADIQGASTRVGDPLWRMPFWPGYEALLDSPVADMNNVSDAPFAGSIVAALFLRRFVKLARLFAHFDIYGWRAGPKPLGPKGGEPQATRAMFEVLEATYAR
jgi:leucyl aminopeptidase